MPKRCTIILIANGASRLFLTGSHTIVTFPCRFDHCTAVFSVTYLPMVYSVAEIRTRFGMSKGSQNNIVIRNLIFGYSDVSFEFDITFIADPILFITVFGTSIWLCRNILEDM